MPTLGVEVTPFRLDSKPGVAMNVWDTSGDPRYAGLGPEAYAIQADAIVVLHRETVEGSAEWLELALKGAPRAQVTHVINRAGASPAEGPGVIDAANQESVLGLLNSLLLSLRP